MSDLSHFESRTGNLSCTSEECFVFVTDIRNFERFTPHGTITNWKADKDKCSFGVSVLGNVAVSISEKVMFSKVVFEGDALKKNDFTIVLHIAGSGSSSADVKIKLSADLNPMLKMMAAKPIAQFLEMLIKEMEDFRGWKEIRE